MQAPTSSHWTGLLPRRAGPVHTNSKRGLTEDNSKLAATGLIQEVRHYGQADSEPDRVPSLIQMRAGEARMHLRERSDTGAK
ncbi:MAG TPA: hypothetical protein VHZ52_04615 [Acidobacteriaceae bacterium]|jgi:hypothetical protein|nr:hypothetical protein [Acidobacteriaceae bacterium]